MFGLIDDLVSAKNRMKPTYISSVTNGKEEVRFEEIPERTYPRTRLPVTQESTQKHQARRSCRRQWSRVPRRNEESITWPDSWQVPAFSLLSSTSRCPSSRTPQVEGFSRITTLRSGLAKLLDPTFSPPFGSDVSSRHRLASFQLGT